MGPRSAGRVCAPPGLWAVESSPRDVPGGLQADPPRAVPPGPQLPAAATAVFPCVPPRGPDPSSRRRFPPAVLTHRRLSPLSSDPRGQSLSRLTRGPQAAASFPVTVDTHRICVRFGGAACWSDKCTLYTPHLRSRWPPGWLAEWVSLCVTSGQFVSGQPCSGPCSPSWASVTCSRSPCSHISCRNGDSLVLGEDGASASATRGDVPHTLSARTRAAELPG